MEMEAFTFKLHCQSLKDYWRLWLSEPTIWNWSQPIYVL